MRNEKKAILIICRNHLSKAPRFLMEVNALKYRFRLIGAGLSGSPDQAYSFVDITRVKPVDFHYTYPVPLKKIISLFVKLLFPRKNTAENLLRYNYRKLRKLNYDLIIVHHFSDLELASKLADYKKVKLVFNAHEYYPLEFDSDENWMKEIHPYYTALAKKYLNRMETCFCVGEKIAEKYKCEFGMSSHVITNAKRFYDLKPLILLETEKVKLVHHGNGMRSRCLELMIDVVKLLGERYTLDLILVPGEEDYIEELKALYASDSQIRFPDPVSVSGIPDALNKYDIGIYILPPRNFNDNYALPNKFFEFIQARLAIAIAPSPEMKAIVEKHELGVVANDFTPKALAEQIAALSVEKINYYKTRSHQNAKLLSVEENERVIRETIEYILS